MQFATTIEDAWRFLTEFGGQLKTGDQKLSIKQSNRGDWFLMETPKPKDEGGKYFLDERILEIIEDDFYSVSDRMACQLNKDKLEPLLEYLIGERGYSLAAPEMTGAARAMLGVELPSFNDASPIPEQSSSGELNAGDASGDILSEEKYNQPPVNDNFSSADPVIKAVVSPQQRGTPEKNVAKLLERGGLFQTVMESEDFHLKIENEPFIPLVIERHGNQLYLTHYLNDYGDVYLDSEMVFMIIKDGSLRLKETATSALGREWRGCDRSYATMFSRNLLDQGFTEAIQERLAVNDTTRDQEMEDKLVPETGTPLELVPETTANRVDVGESVAAFLDDSKVLNEIISSDSLSWRVKGSFPDQSICLERAADLFILTANSGFSAKRITFKITDDNIFQYQNTQTTADDELSSEYFDEHEADKFIACLREEDYTTKIAVQINNLVSLSKEGVAEPPNNIVPEAPISTNLASAPIFIPVEAIKATQRQPELESTLTKQTSRRSPERIFVSPQGDQLSLFDIAAGIAEDIVANQRSPDSNPDIEQESYFTLQQIPSSLLPSVNESELNGVVRSPDDTGNINTAKLITLRFEDLADWAMAARDLSLSGAKQKYIQSLVSGMRKGQAISIPEETFDEMRQDVEKYQPYLERGIQVLEAANNILELTGETNSQNEKIFKGRTYEIIEFRDNLSIKKFSNGKCDTIFQSNRDIPSRTTVEPEDVAMFLKFIQRLHQANASTR
ncbi:hypothetical protein G7B40_030850 [Aetokthonos hydrillicola Thurmond2011]|uniref:DUF6908 domain-containing protein n=2 Tax=Aetokthonos TaxID=1550243 RepID=A0AAP5MCZ0_9CYAN|nr:hypothetical protein [Aetokthonos hydrillicola]MBO3463999.1 hypothetical protein [Aetokthonos hydrillicola CCALA 1050]MBW4589669.1 hypothetical protein [Aetokthonos hydrillicola CCALA 1050]MDR9898923.1 hypothetical protein [Aetokthonos hydrillicola Thurmond2011]